MKKLICENCNGTGVRLGYEVRIFGSCWRRKRCEACLGVGFLRSGDINEDEEKELGNLPEINV